MATVAAVYGIEPHVRSEQQFIAALRRSEPAPANPRPRPERKRVWASLVKEPVTVIDEAFHEARRRDPFYRKRWVVLIDGSRDLERWVREVAARHGASVTVVLDVIHAIEWLWRAVYGFHEEGSREAEPWVLERLGRLLRGEAASVAAGIRRSATRRGLKDLRRKNVDDCANYFHRHKHNMGYDEFLALGIPIGTGVIEGACRHLICDRLDVTGARWRIECAEAVLRLRAIIASGDFDEYWQFHEAEERRRNHDTNYAGEMPPKLVHPKQARHLRLLRDAS